MLARNPLGRCYLVTHPRRDETGRYLVPSSYWKSIQEEPVVWQVYNPCTRTVALETARWWLARMLSVLGYVVIEKEEWLEVEVQGKYLTVMDPDTGQWLEMPEEV